GKIVQQVGFRQPRHLCDLVKCRTPEPVAREDVKRGVEDRAPVALLDARALAVGPDRAAAAVVVCRRHGARFPFFCTASGRRLNPTFRDPAMSLDAISRTVAL